MQDVVKAMLASTAGMLSAREKEAGVRLSVEVNHILERALLLRLQSNPDAHIFQLTFTASLFVDVTWLQESNTRVVLRVLFPVC